MRKILQEQYCVYSSRIVSFVLLLLVTGFSAIAQPKIEFNKYYHAPLKPDDTSQDEAYSGEDWFYSVKPINENGKTIGFICSGYSTYPNLEATDGCITPYSANPHPYDFDIPDGNPWGLPERNHGNPFPKLTKLDAEGNVIWYKNFGIVGSKFSLQGRFYNAIPTDDGGFIAVGKIQMADGILYNKTTSSSGTAFPCSTDVKPHAYAVKVNSAGTITWQYLFGREDVAEDDYIEGVESVFYDIQKVESNYIMCGTLSTPQSSNSKGDIFLVKINENGEIIDKNVFSTITNIGNIQYNGSTARSITKLQSDDDYVYIGGFIQDYNVPNRSAGHALVVKVNTSNLEQASNSTPFIYIANELNNYCSSAIFDITIDINGDLIVPVLYCSNSVLYLYENGHGSADGKVFKLDISNLQSIDEFYLGAFHANDLQMGVTALQDGGFAVASTKRLACNGSNPSYPDCFWYQDDCDHPNSPINLGYNSLCPGNLVVYDKIYWDTDAYVTRFDASGNQLWEKIIKESTPPTNWGDPLSTYGTYDFDHEPPNSYGYVGIPFLQGDLKREECLYKIVQTSDGGLVLCGNNSNNLDDDVLIKLYDDCETNLFPLNASVDHYNITTPGDEFYLASTTETWDDNAKLYGRLRIRDGEQLTITNCTIQVFNSKKTSDYNNFKPSDIVVEPGGKLIVDDATITSIASCGNPWQGIQVHGIMNQNQDIDGSGMSNQGYVVLNDAIIENAENAIRVHNPAWSSTNFHGGGGIVQATNTTFRNNRRDVEFLKYAPNTLYTWFVGNRSFFRNCTFETTAALPEGKNPTAHVTMWGTSGIKFEGCTFENTRTTGIDNINQLGEGINSIDAHYRITPDPSNITDKTIFKNLKEGVRASNAAQLLPVFIQNCVFDNVYRGATLTNANFSTVAGNLFKVGKTNTLTSFADYPYGLGLNYTTQFTCTGNNFVKASGATNLHTGIWYSNTGGMENVSRDNIFTDLTVAQLTNGLNRQADNGNQVTPKQGLQLLCNQHDNSTFYDIAVWNQFFAGLPNGQEGVRDLQGRLGTGSAGHIAVRNTFSSPAFADGHIGNYGKYITYYTKDGEPSELPTQVDVSKVSVISTNSDNECNFATDNIPGDRKLNETELGELKLDFATHRANFISYNSLLKSLIDNGNTSGYVEEVFSVYTEDGAWQLRHDLLGMSPFLSDSVLFAAAARQDVFSHAELFELLVANPDGFWYNVEQATEFLAENESSLPEWMVDYLWDMHESEHPVTYRTLLESYRAQESEVMFSTWRTIVADILMDSTGYNPDSLMHWLANIEHYESEIELGWALYNTGNHDTSIIDYMDDFNSYLNSYINIDSSNLQSDVAWNNNFISYLVNFGNNFVDTASQFYLFDTILTLFPDSGVNSGRRRIKNALDYFVFADSAKHTDHPLFPDMTYGKKEKETRRKRTRRVAQPYVKAYPNPANKVLTVEYALPEGLPEADIQIVDLNGRTVWQQKVTEPQFLRNINLDSWQNGFYQYSASYKGISIGTGKVVVIK